ncbi:MAG: hypothetical protein NE327_21070 [Lentisphaeraceae bacterium]|nr:hypothetical protein [Lentisphaeraceae bacterium]
MKLNALEIQKDIEKTLNRRFASLGQATVGKGKNKAMGRRKRGHRDYEVKS